MTIAPMHVADLPAVLAIEAASFTPPWGEPAMRAELESAHGYCRVAREGDRVLAFLVARDVAGELELLQVATHPAMRRAGCGRALVAALCAHADAARAPVFLEVRPSNVAAVHLYATLGFAALATRRGYYADGEDAAVLRREPEPAREAAS